MRMRSEKEGKQMEGKRKFWDLVSVQGGRKNMDQLEESGYGRGVAALSRAASAFHTQSFRLAVFTFPFTRYLPCLARSI